MSNTEIGELKEILINFIEGQTKFNEGQKAFNEGQKAFNEKQKAFNEKIDKKIDKVQYFLEETIAENTKMFFEEQIRVKAHVKELEYEVSSLKEDILELTAQFRAFQRNLS